MLLPGPPETYSGGHTADLETSDLVARIVVQAGKTEILPGFWLWAYRAFGLHYGLESKGGLSRS